MSLALLSNASGKRGISHSQSKVDAGFVKVYWIIDGASLPVVLVDLKKGTFLELRDYSKIRCVRGKSSNRSQKRVQKKPLLVIATKTNISKEIIT